MLIRIHKSSEIKENQVTEEKVYHNRRQLLKSMVFLGASALLASSQAHAFNLFGDDDSETLKTKVLKFSQPENYKTSYMLTLEQKIISHNNFYEFGTGKSDPVTQSQQFKVDPWSLTIDGLVEKPITLAYEELYKSFELEERIYRLRCVEAWSMVVPWIGFYLADLTKKANPLSSAKYVVFEALYEPEQMPGQRNRFSGGGINYPYVEGLRLDEAMHPLL
jgi:sulfoxide reductase catalytic subunit YedY